MNFCIFRFILIVNLLEGAFFVVPLFLLMMLTELSVSIQAFSTLLMEVLLFFLPKRWWPKIIFFHPVICLHPSHLWGHFWLHTSSFPPFLRETATLVLLLHQICCSSWFCHLSSTRVTPRRVVVSHWVFVPLNCLHPLPKGAWQSEGWGGKCWVRVLHQGLPSVFPSLWPGQPWPLWLHSRRGILLCLLQPFL